MLKNRKKNVSINATSTVTATTDGVSKEIDIEYYNCVINSDNPEKMSISRNYVNKEGEEAYEDHREECRTDYKEFQDLAYALQDELFELKKEEAAKE